IIELPRNPRGRAGAQDVRDGNEERPKQERADAPVVFGFALVVDRVQIRAISAHIGSSARSRSASRLNMSRLIAIAFSKHWQTTTKSPRAQALALPRLGGQRVGVSV